MMVSISVDDIEKSIDGLSRMKIRAKPEEKLMIDTAIEIMNTIIEEKEVRVVKKPDEFWNDMWQWQYEDDLK